MSAPSATPTSSHLDAAFITSWNTLPDELKFHILSYKVALANLPDARCHRGTEINWKTHTQYYHLLLKPLIRTSREIFQLSQQAYYRDNRFTLRSSCVSGLNYGPDTSCFRYPHAPLNSFIRTIELELTIDKSEWKILQRIADGTYGFDNLARVELVLQWGERPWCRWTGYALDIPNLRSHCADSSFPPIYFKAKGSLAFEKTDNFIVKTDLNSCEMWELEASIGEKIMFNVDRGESTL